MDIISKSDFLKFVREHPENVILLRCEQGVLTLLSELERAGDSQTLRINEMSFELRWRSCESALTEINECRNRHSGGISVSDYDSDTEAITEFINNSASYIKYVIADDTELETVARCFPCDIIYLYINPVEQPEKPKRKSRKTLVKTA